MSKEDLFRKIISHAKEYGFIFPSSEIYDGLSAVYDYGQNGVELKNNIRQYWWKSMVQMHENIVGIDSAIFMHPSIWKASGHVDAFNDPLIDNRDSKKRYRADILLEDYILKIEDKINKEVAKANKRFGENFDEKMYRETNPRVMRYLEEIEDVRTKMNETLGNDDLVGVKALIEELKIACPISGSRNWTDVRQFNLMFSTQMGSTSEGAEVIYLRPETAQGIFVNFLNVMKSGRMRVPFGIAQTGKAFRNEIVARQFIFRMREFEQMEMQFFVRPGEELKWFEYWKEERYKWLGTLGISEEKLRYHDHEKLAHYANAATDIEFDFPFGFRELEGIHSRTDFDLKAHQDLSGKKLQYFDPETNENYIPYVVETSIGMDRMFLAIFSNAYNEETLEDGSLRTVLNIPPILSPYKVAVLPLVRKDGMPEKAKEILDDLRFDFNCQYDDKDAIGRRYRRQDAIGTPYCVTIDTQTMEDNTVTIRERDSMKQERVDISMLSKIIGDRLKANIYRP
ncbi:MAG: glycine--tRNA ligase [Bacteroidales bacterium]|jgi:glycyl-tRNA synthetase|nr:glycine--tRNA ligase [Bacteroidales bacterium]